MDSSLRSSYFMLLCNTVTLGQVTRPRLAKQAAYIQARLKPPQLSKQAAYIQANDLHPSKRLTSKLDSNLLEYPSNTAQPPRPDSNLLEYPSDTAQPQRLGSKKNHYHVPVDVTVPSNSRPVECSTCRSTIGRGRGGRLPLSVRRVLGTSRDLYEESTGLLGATINLHTGVVARGTASWTQQARPLRCSFSFNPFHPLLGSGGDREKLPGLRCLDLGFRQRPAR